MEWENYDLFLEDHYFVLEREEEKIHLCTQELVICTSDATIQNSKAKSHYSSCHHKSCWRQYHVYKRGLSDLLF